MFDFAWSEIALIGVVALIAIGPKDLPVAMKTVSSFIKKARRMAGEFQTHVDEMVRDADLSEVRNQLNEIRNFDIQGELQKAVDPDGSIRQTFAENPMSQFDPPASDVPTPILVESEPVIDAPSFIPPDIAKKPLPPAFLPPGTTRY